MGSPLDTECAIVVSYLSNDSGSAIFGYLCARGSAAARLVRAIESLLKSTPGSVSAKTKLCLLRSAEKRTAAVVADAGSAGAAARALIAT